MFLPRTGIFQHRREFLERVVDSQAHVDLRDITEANDVVLDTLRNESEQQCQQIKQLRRRRLTIFPQHFSTEVNQMLLSFTDNICPYRLSFPMKLHRSLGTDTNSTNISTCSTAIDMT